MTATKDRRDATAELVDTLGRLIRTTRVTTHRHSAEYGLSGTPLGILKTLAEGDARPGDVALRLQIAPSVVSRAVVPLEQAELVERRLDPDDARAWRLGLTEAGRRRLRAARSQLVDRLAPMLADWDADDIATLTSLMDRLESTICRQVAPTLPTYDLDPAGARIRTTSLTDATPTNASLTNASLTNKGHA